MDGIDGGRAHQVTLPIGSHELRLEVVDRLPVRQRIEIAARETLSIRPALRWTDAARRVRVRDASRRRRRGWAVAGSGAAIVAAAVALLGWNVARANELEDYQPWLDCMKTGADCSDLEPEDRQRATMLEDSVPAVRAGGLLILGTGVGVAIVGAVVASTAADSAEIDRAASATLELRLSPTGLHLSGQF